MLNFKKAAIAALFFVLLPLNAWGAGERALSDDQWRQDLYQLQSLIKEKHFKPFTEVSEAEFDAAVATLDQKIPGLSDHDIILEMAKIISLLKDGHTRLAIPRAYPDLALQSEYGHSGTAPPSAESLKLTSLPVSFSLFSDGLFVTGATPEHDALLGQKVLKIGETPTEQALEAAKPYAFYENDMRAKLIATDRLAIPALLKHAGLVDDAAHISLTLAGEDGEVVVSLQPMTGVDEGWLVVATESVPLWQQDRDAKYWYEILPLGDAIYVRVDEFVESPNPPFSDFVAETIKAAEDAGVSRYILDLRHNFGGTGTWTTSFYTGIARSEFNEYGRLYVLIGRETYSASQLLLHKFEEYTYAMFVGEQGGASPSHFGDPVKKQLENSGITLRVSKLYWPSWTSGEFRKANNPHVEALLSSADYFAGQDPALQAALDYQAPATLGEQIAEQFKQGKTQNGVIQFTRYVTDGTIPDHTVEIPGLVAAGHKLLDEGQTRPGYFMFLLTNEYLPRNAASAAGYGRAFEMVGDLKKAKELYGEALDLDPANLLAAEGLERLSQE